MQQGLTGAGQIPRAGPAPVPVPAGAELGPAPALCTGGAPLLCLSRASHVPPRARVGRCSGGPGKDGMVERGALQSAHSQQQGCSAGKEEILCPGGLRNHRGEIPAVSPPTALSRKITELPSPRSNGQSSAEQLSGAELGPSEHGFPMPKSKGAGSWEGKQGSRSWAGGSDLLINAQEPQARQRRLKNPPWLREEEDAA